MSGGRLLDGPPAATHASHIALVTSVQDPLALGRVQLRLVAFDAVPDQDAAVWARVAVPFAGGGRGAFLLPSVGDEVLVTLVNGDPRQPVVVGSLWNGADAPPERLGGAGDRVDRWTLVGRNGTRIAIVEERDGAETIRLETPAGGPSVVIDHAAGGSVVLDTGAGTTVTLDTQGVSVRTAGRVQVQASQVEVSAGMVRVDAAMSRFSGVVQCDALIANSVVSAVYSPGAGNVW